MKAFHIYCNGFTKVLYNAADAQTFINSLRTKGCVGHEVVVTLGTIDPAFPGAAVYNLKNTRRELLSAH